MDIKKYGDDVFKYIDILSDEEFDAMMVRAGIEKCPLEEKETNIPLWGRIISWILGSMVLLVALLIYIFGSWTIGISMLKNIKEFGLLQSLIGLGIGGLVFIFLGLLTILLIAIIRRIMKWKWLKIPIE